MKHIEQIAELRGLLDEERAAGRRVGLVPTMGYLHDGHVSLMTRARSENDVVVATIFVNPLQFAADEDLDDYPRDLEGDGSRAAAAGVDVLFVPTTEEMYPEPVRTTVTVPELSATMEGASRPTHFAGVATVVAKLFALVGACRAYFGEKDFQQLVIIRTMAADLSFPVAVEGCPIVRADDGLALSSRNAYLSPAERAAAPVLHRALAAGAAQVDDGERDPARVVTGVTEEIVAEAEADLDYVALVDAGTLAPVGDGDLAPGEYRLLGAARFGRPRLLDNVAVVVP